jgi:S-adenosylmethionine synthetase
VAKPLSIYVDLADNPNKIDTAKLETVLAELMDLSPRGIRKHLDLNKPIYARTSAYGHFGREPDNEGGFSWEKTDLAATLKSEITS